MSRGRKNKKRSSIGYVGFWEGGKNIREGDKNERIRGKCSRRFDPMAREVPSCLLSFLPTIKMRNS